MKATEFDRLLKDRLAKTRLLLESKAGEYATGDDRLHNFRRAAEDFPGPGPTSPAAALLGMLRKHWVSLADMAERHALGNPIAPAAVDEKIGDAVNYLILLEAVLSRPK